MNLLLSEYSSVSNLVKLNLPVSKNGPQLSS